MKNLKFTIHNGEIFVIKRVKEKNKIIVVIEKQEVEKEYEIIKKKKVIERRLKNGKQ